ncbi:hypothetical protein Tco_1082556 [Tanacetum coccineum]|uniref:Uncharacterized protein n=1 Tax=Tanacetum coccineum TaxID=301880 RepID=A0ABQ5I0Q2_9ASTR
MLQLSHLGDNMWSGAGYFANDTFFKEIKEFEQIFDELEAEYEQCVLDNKNLTIEKKNLLIINECLIAECLEKDICSIVLTSDIVVPPSSNCLCEDLRSACDREHTKVLELEAEVLKQQKMVIESEKRNSHLQKTHIDLQLKFQNYKQCIDTSSASNAIFEINKLRQQLQGKDDTIRNLDAQINIMKVLNVGSTEGSCDQQALETDRIQLKDTITSLRIQLDGLKVENVSLKRRYDELSKANTHSRTAYTEKINALTAENAKLKTELRGKKSGGSTASEKPKVLASGMYTKSSKYIPPPKRANWVKPTPLPKKKQVTFQEPPRTSNRPTQKPPVQQNKKPNVSVNLSTRTKPATESRKPMPKSHTRNHRILPNKSVNARRAADHNRKLNVVDHNRFVIRSLKSVNTKTPHAKHSVNHTKKVWKATRNHNVNTTKTAWRPTRKVVGSVKPQWKPTGRHFALYDNCPLTRIMEPIVEPLELTPSVSSSSKVTMISRSKGRTVADSIAERLTRPTAYKFKTDCSIIPVWDRLSTNMFQVNHVDAYDLRRDEGPNVLSLSMAKLSSTIVYQEMHTGRNISLRAETEIDDITSPLSSVSSDTEPKNVPTDWCHMKLDGLKVENVSLKRRYDELSQANTHSRTAYTEKLSALTSENTKLKALVHGKTSSGPSTSEKPKVLALGMYTNSSKIMEPIVEPLELTPSVSSSSKVTMISRFPDCKLSDRKAGSKGLSGIFEC